MVNCSWFSCDYIIFIVIKNIIIELNDTLYVSQYCLVFRVVINGMAIDRLRIEDATCSAP